MAINTHVDSGVVARGGLHQIGSSFYQVSHQGLVVEKGERYLWDGDYVYWAVVWNPIKHEFEQIDYGSTRSYHYAEVDAPPTLIAAWAAEKRRRHEEAAQLYAEHQAKKRAEQIRRGSIVRVVRGRKVPIGIEGMIFWVGDSSFGPRAGLRDQAGETYWISLANLELLRQTEA